MLSSADSDSGKAFQERYNLSTDPDSLLHEILSRSEFQQAPKETSWDRIEKRLQEILLGILRWLAGKIGLAAGKGGFDAHPLWRIVEGLLIAMVLLLAVFLAKVICEHLRDHIAPHSEPPRDQGAASWYLSSGRLLEEAMQHARKGDYRTGLILLFRSVLLRLEEEGKIAHHRGKTNREIIRSISGDRVVREVVTQLVPVFDGVCYGEAPCGKDEYDRFLNQCARLIPMNVSQS